MKADHIFSLLSFVLLLLAQVLICNHIHIFDCATPLLYVYFILPAKRNTPKWYLLLLSFILGLCVDLFTNTPGVAAASMTLTAFIQPYLLTLFIPYDSPDDFQPTFRTLGVAKYMGYTFILVLINVLTFYSIEIFNFFNIVQWACCVGGSTLITLLLVWVLENLMKR